MILVGVIGLILLLAGLVMVLSSAFKHRLNWGLAILFVPVIAPVYAIYNWSDHRARNGLFTVIIGLLVVAAALYGGVGRYIAALSTEVHNEQVQERVKDLIEIIPTAGPPDKPLPNEAEANVLKSKTGEDYDAIYGDDQYAYSNIEALPPDEDVRVVVPEQADVTYEYQVITAAQVGKFINKQLKVATKRGELREGKLIRSDEDSLYLESLVEGGIAQFQYEFTNLDALLVYEAKGVVAAMNAPAIEVSASEPGASTSQETPPTNVSANDAAADTHVVKSAEPAVPAQGHPTKLTNVVPTPLPAESSAQAVESSPQGETAQVQTISVKPATPLTPSEPTPVAPESKSSDKPVIYIKPKSSAVEKRSPAAQQPQAESTQATETSMVTPHPESAMTSSGVQ